MLRLFRRLRSAESATRRLSPESIFLGIRRAETKQAVDDPPSDPNDIGQRQGDQDTAPPTPHPANPPTVPTPLGYGAVEGLDRPILSPYLPCGCRRYQDDADAAMTRRRETLFDSFESKEDGINHLLSDWRSKQNSDRSMDSGKQLRRQNSMPTGSIIRRMACGRETVDSGRDCPPSLPRRPTAVAPPSLGAAVCLLRGPRAVDDECLFLRRLRLKEAKRRKRRRTQTVTEGRPLISVDCCHVPCVAHRCHFERSPAAMRYIDGAQVSSLPAA